MNLEIRILKLSFKYVSFSHVAYTVANSVLHEVESCSLASSLSFPPLSLGQISALNLSKKPRFALNYVSKLSSSFSSPSGLRDPKNLHEPSTPESTSDACCSSSYNSAPSATVQSNHVIMHVVESTEQPRIAADIYPQSSILYFCSQKVTFSFSAISTRHHRSYWTSPSCYQASRPEHHQRSSSVLHLRIGPRCGPQSDLLNSIHNLNIT